MKKRMFFAMTALFCVTMSFAQEYMVFENINGGLARFDVDVIKQAYFKTYEATGSGTSEDPFNVAAANAQCKETGVEPSTQQYYVKGYVYSVSQSSVMASFYIADDMSGINRLYAYNVIVPMNYKIQVRDEIVILASLYNYKNLTPEATGQIVSINGQTIETPQPQGSGTIDDPYNVAGVIEYVSGLGADVVSPKDVYFKGYVTFITEPYTTQYGNATFEISDTEEGGNKFLCYRALYFDKSKYSDTKDPNIKEGDLVVMCGKVVNYKGTMPETSANNSYIYSLNGNTSGGGGGDTNSAKGTGTQADPYNAAGANQYIATLAADTESPNDVYIKGKVVKYANNGEFSTKYGNASFYISDDGTESGEQFYVFRTLYLGNVKYTEGVTPKVGDDVVICGKVVNYKGNNPETVANKSYIYSLNDNTGGVKGTGHRNTE